MFLKFTDTPTIYSILSVERHRYLLGIVVQHQVQWVCKGLLVLDARHIVVQVEYKATRFTNYIDAIYNHFLLLLILSFLGMFLYFMRISDGSASQLFSAEPVPVPA